MADTYTISKNAYQNTKNTTMQQGKNHEYVKDIKYKIEYKKENTGARKEKQKYRLIQLQNIENAKKMKDTGQIYKDYFTFREENLSGKKKKRYQRKKQYIKN